MMTATMAPATMAPATMEPAAVFAAVMFAAVEFTAVVSFTVEFAEAFAAVKPAIAEVRGIAVAVASVIPPPVGTSRQIEGRNQKRN